MDNSAGKQPTAAGVNVLRERAKDEKGKGLQLNFPESLPSCHLVGGITWLGRMARCQWGEGWQATGVSVPQLG